MLTVILILMVTAGSTVGVPIDERLEEYCKTLLAIYEKDPESKLVQGIIEPWVCRSLDAMEESDFFLPKVLIWCPLTRFKITLKCPTHGNALRTGVWKVSTKLSCEPRLLFDLNGNTLLVARFYVCSGRGVYHRILSSDQLLREQIQEDLEIPFILSHRSGYTLRFLTHVRVEIGLGINFNEISHSLKKMNLENFEKRRNLMLLLYKHHKMKEPHPRYLDESEFRENPLYAYPSDDHIREMFLMNFRQTRCVYESDMKKLSASSVCMFHTSKVISIVGTTRSRDDRWVSDYSSVFVVVNERGEIIKWCFCTDNDFEEIKVLLHELNGRLKIKGRVLTHAMVHSCCSWRPLLQEIFGTSLEVKQDLHQVSQILVISSPERQACFDQFGMVFRDLDDKGPCRLKPTPPPAVIKLQLDEFLEEWEQTLSRESLKKLRDLEVHILNGCVSGIPIGHEMRKNEDLNELLNKSLVPGATRLGPELAFALITVLFYIVNGKLRRKKQLYDVYPENTSSAKELDGESFGFLPNVADSTIIALSKPISSAQQQSDRIRGSLHNQSNTHPRNSSIHSILREDVLQILVPEALELHDMLQHLSTRFAVKSISVWDLPLFCSDKALMLLSRRGHLSNGNDPVSDMEDSATLLGRLEEFNLELETVEKDGNCAFMAVALQIKHVLKHVNEEDFREFLASLGILENQPTPLVGSYLRGLFVKELISNMDEYYPSTHGLTTEMFLEEAKSFQLDGVFTSQLGDFVMKALSKILCSAILVITSMPAIEVIPFIPTAIKCKTPLFVAYNQRGPGHYDSTTDKVGSDWASDSGSGSNVANSKYAPTQGKCRCGRGKLNTSQGEILSCTNKCDNLKYNTRCPCYRLQQGCTRMCRCLNCGNEFNSDREDLSGEKLLKRKRSSVESKKRKKGEDFLNELRQNDPAFQVTWSPFESCVFEAALRFLSLSEMRLSAENAVEIYNFIAKSTSVSSMGLELRCKTQTQIECKLKARKEASSLFNNIQLPGVDNDMETETLCTVNNITAVDN